MPFADLAQHVLHRHLAVVEDQWRGGRAANAHLLLFRAHGKAGEVLLHQEGRELLAIDLRKDGKQVREVGVGDPHLLAVQDVVLAIGRQHRLGAAVQRVRAAGAFRQRVGANDFAGRQFRQVFLFLRFRAEEDERQRPDAGVCAHGDDEAAALGHVIGNDGGRDLVHVRAAILRRNVSVGQAHFGGLLQQVDRDLPFLVLDLLHGGEEFVDRKFIREFRDHLVVFGKVFGGEYVLQFMVFEQKASARGLGLRDRCCRRCHINLPWYKSCSLQKHGENSSPLRHEAQRKITL